jgi:glutathione S-transferase
LNEKAEWHKNVNGGLVPILETTDGQMVQESAVLAQFASDYAPKGQGLPLWPHEAAEPGDAAACMKTAKAKIQIQRFDKFNSKFWQVWMGRWKNQEKNEDYKTQFPEMEAFFTENLGDAKFMSGTDHPNYLDIHCFSLLERVII